MLPKIPITLVLRLETNAFRNETYRSQSKFECSRLISTVKCAIKCSLLN